MTREYYPRKMWRGARLPAVVLLIGLLYGVVSCVRAGYGTPSTGDEARDSGPTADGHLGDLWADSSPSDPEAIGLPPGGTFDEIVVQPGKTSTLYLYSAGGRVFRSTDKASSWAECALPPARDISTLTVAANGWIYISQWDGVHESHDQCASWTPAHGPGAPRGLLALSNWDLYAADEGLWRRRNGSWGSLSVPTGNQQLETLAASPDEKTIYVGSNADGLLRSQDGGASWARVNNGFPLDQEVHQIFVDPATPSRVFVGARGGLYRSTNSGDSWSMIRGGDAYSVALSGDLLVIETPGGIKFGSAGGADFSEQDQRSPEMANSRSRLLFDPEQPGRLYAAGGRGLFVTTLTGSSADWTWSAQHGDISAWGIHCIVQQEDPSVLHLGTSAGMLRSDDDGESWTLHGGFRDYGMVHGCALDSTHEDAVLVAGNDLLRSENHGLSYQIITHAEGDDRWSFQTIIEDQGDYIMGSSRRLLFSSDGGGSWDAQVVGTLVQDLMVVDTLIGRPLLVATDDRLLLAERTPPYTISDGNIAGDILSLARDSAGLFYVGNRDGVHRASSPTGPWQRIGLPKHHVHDLLIDQGTIIAATHLGLFHASTSIPDWVELSALKNRTPNKLARDPQGRLLVGTHGFNLYRIPWPE